MSYFLTFKFRPNQELTLRTEVIITEIGILIGVIFAQLTQSFILNTEILWFRVPNVFLIGSFIGIGFLYFRRHKEAVNSNRELSKINDKLRVQKEKTYLKNIHSKVGSEYKVINILDVYYFISKDHYTYAITERGEYIVEFPIKVLNEQLDPNIFFKVSRSAIINLEIIESLKSEGQLLIKTTQGETLQVSRSQAKKLKSILLK